MTRAQAADLLAELVGDDPYYRPALELLRPKARAVVGGQSPRMAAACRTILRNLRRPDGFGGEIHQGRHHDRERTETRYLDTFGPKDSPERKAQAYRVARTMIDGPQETDYGLHAAPDWSDFPPDGWETYNLAVDLHGAERALWIASPDGLRYFADRERFEARSAQFAYTGPKASAKDDERATFALAVLGGTGGLVPPAALEVAA